MHVIFLYCAYKNPNEVPGFGNYKPLIVLTNSMKGTFQEGDLIFIKKVEPKSLQEGDVIAYRLENGKIITHRIAEILKEDDHLLFVTKGDYNSAVDRENVLESQVQGKFIKKYSNLGNLLLMYQNPFVLILTSVVILGLIIYSFKDSIFGKRLDQV